MFAVLLLLLLLLLLGVWSVSERVPSDAVGGGPAGAVPDEGSDVLGRGSRLRSGGCSGGVVVFVSTIAIGI
jgi:hypothetical protein